MGVAKVNYNNETLIDLTADTVTADTLRAGETAHDAEGNAVVGLYTPSAEYTKYATGAFEQSLAYGKWTLTTSALTFKPRMLVLILDSYSSATSYMHHGITLLFDAAGGITKSWFAGRGTTTAAGLNVDQCTGNALENGFNVVAPEKAWSYKNARDTTTFYAYA